MACDAINVRLEGEGPVDCQSSGMNERRDPRWERVQVHRADEKWEGKRGTGLFVRVGDADLLTNAQSVAIQAGIKVQHAIETATVGLGNLPACIARLDVIVGAALRASFRRRLRVNGSDQSENQEKADCNKQNEWEQGAVG